MATTDSTLLGFIADLARAFWKGYGVRKGSACVPHKDGQTPRYDIGFAMSLDNLASIGARRLYLRKAKELGKRVKRRWGECGERLRLSYESPYPAGEEGGLAFGAELF